MEGQCLLLQLLLLAFTVTMGLDIYTGTTVPPSIVNLSFDGGPKHTALDYPENLKYNATIYFGHNYEDFAEFCWMVFVDQMTNVSKVHWCEWRAISRPYTDLRFCLEGSADHLNHSFPNALAENYIVSSHRLYFLNCTQKHPPFLDPPENVLLLLIITPICLIPFLVTLVVLKSKDGETQA